LSSKQSRHRAGYRPCHVTHEGRMQTERLSVYAGSRLEQTIDPGRHRLTRQPFSRTGENPPYGMLGGIEETSASFEARSAPQSHPTAGGVQQWTSLPRSNRWPSRTRRDLELFLSYQSTARRLFAARLLDLDLRPRLGRLSSASARHWSGPLFDKKNRPRAALRNGQLA
jgi:hypothetical protein